MDRSVALLRDLPLKEADSVLLSHLVSVAIRDLGGNEALLEALPMAAYLHRKDTRANRGGLPRDPYINHPLRVAARLVRFGCSDHEILAAAVLHDTIEDHADQVVIAYAEEALSGNASLTREKALAYYADLFGPYVAELVSSVSNPIHEEQLSREERVAAYHHHVRSIKDAGAFLIKISDFIDNAASLHHNVGREDMQRRLAQKYLPLIPFFRSRLRSKEVAALLPVVSAAGVAEMKRALSDCEPRLRRLAAPAEAD